MTVVRAILFVLVMLTALTSAQAPAQDPIQKGPTFSSRISAVQVDVLVTENNRPVNGLQAGDFEVLDNGVRQDVDLISGGSVPLNLVLALDTSGSVVGARLDQLRSAATALIDHLHDDDRAGLVTFNRVVVQGSPLTHDLRSVRTALGASAASGETALRNGVFTGLTMGQAGAGRALLIVFSDGIDTASWLPAQQVLDIARRTDVIVYGISTARSRKVPFLDDVCAVTGGKLFQGEWSATLSDTFLAVLEEFRHRYVLTYTPRGVETGGWHRLAIKVKGRNVKINARAGYLSR